MFSLTHARGAAFFPFLAYWFSGSTLMESEVMLGEGPFDVRWGGGGWLAGCGCAS